ncbi:cyclin-domain-containing protein [Halteromyces radiatus]|uniref:cyclin-domain-containing protein n=1 Tax=Halteromyces radiatus TaxID=101107 RepID=UPI00221EFE6F|nr:cyclin-domain-containing protein [Halteromyces radiatus]KAI8081505.1 cyclin-domain-containing protein [Halteromyces radiatus]
MTSLLSTTGHYYASTLHCYYHPPAPVTQTLSSVRFTEPSHQTDPEMYALRAMLSAHRTLPYSGRRTCNGTKNSTLNNRLAYVEALVDTNALVIETMWCSTIPSNRQASVVPLRTFIQEVLKRSRTTYSTLQTALFYLFRSRPAIMAHLRQCQQDKWEGAYISCGRRMFLASLVVASKFVQDKTYRNSAWAKIAGLPVAEINAAERIFLDLVDYRLYISQPTFEQWHHLLHMHVEAKTQNHPMVLLSYNMPTTTSTPTTPTLSSSSLSSSQQSSTTSPITSPINFPSIHHHHHHHLFSQQQQQSHFVHQSPYYEQSTSRRKRQRTSSDTTSPSLSSSPSSTPMPVLTISLPSSNHSSPLQTPTQISPIRCQLWKPVSPKKRKLDNDYFIPHQQTRQWNQRHG